MKVKYTCVLVCIVVLAFVTGCDDTEYYGGSVSSQDVTNDYGDVDVGYEVSDDEYRDTGFSEDVEPLSDMFILTWENTGESHFYIFGGNATLEPEQFSFRQLEDDLDEDGLIPESFLLGIFCFNENLSTGQMYKQIPYRGLAIGETFEAYFEPALLEQYLEDAEECLAFLNLGCSQKGGSSCWHANEYIFDANEREAGIRLIGKMFIQLPDQPRVQLHPFGPHWLNPNKVDRAGFYGGPLGGIE